MHCPFIEKSMDILILQCCCCNAGYTYMTVFQIMQNRAVATFLVGTVQGTAAKSRGACSTG